MFVFPCLLWHLRVIAIRQCTAESEQQSKKKNGFLLKMTLCESDGAVGAVMLMGILLCNPSFFTICHPYFTWGKPLETMLEAGITLRTMHISVISSKHT